MLRLREQPNELGAALRHVAPLPTDPFRKQRVRRALTRGRGPVSRLRFAFASIAGVIALSAFASAMSGRVSWRAPAPALMPSHDAIEPFTTPRVRAIAPTIPLAPRETAPPASPPSGATLMLEALRSRGEPLVAEARAARYLRQNPRGALCEEAFAVVIGAKVALHDPDVTRVAAEYLVRFPEGRFVELARHAR